MNDYPNAHGLQGIGSGNLPNVEPPPEAPWLTRLRAEHTELCERLFRLRDFIDLNPEFQTLSPGDQLLLRDQLRIMCEYEAVLAARFDRAR